MKNLKILIFFMVNCFGYIEEPDFMVTNNVEYVSYTKQELELSDINKFLTIGLCFNGGFVFSHDFQQNIFYQHSDAFFRYRSSSSFCYGYMPTVFEDMIEFDLKKGIIGFNYLFGARI